MKSVTTLTFTFVVLLSFSKVVPGQEEATQPADQAPVVSAADPSSDDAATKAADQASSVAPASEENGAAAEAAPAGPPESAEHAAARKEVEQLQARLDAETKLKQDIEKKLADAQSDSQRDMLQGIVLTKRDALEILTQDLKDANEALSKLPFSHERADSYSQP